MTSNKSQQRTFDEQGAQDDQSFNTLINKIFATLTVQFPAWAEKYLKDDQRRIATKRLWRYALTGLSEHHVENGIQNMLKKCEFPPVPATFRRLCFEFEGVPDLDQAFHQALSGFYRHDVVRYAALYTGKYKLQRSTTQDAQLKKLFEGVYTEMQRRFMSGEPLDRPVTPALENISTANSKGVADDLINKAMVTQGSNKTGYEAFLEAKRKLGGKQ